ncbi:VWA domain-containing protein [Telmatobacter sp. DSM 110680]|uniref:VWA domain-containing protein n=1 Tax=Telmatobacter sp. DSM 110680 TaxID=3036704 RepID=A0AAU7DIS7_9BACT
MSAAQDQSAQAPAVLSVTTHEVLLDVVVTDGGHAVTGLKSTDFIVTENGNPQVVASLQEHRPMTAATDAQVVAKPPLAPNTFTNYSAVANANAYTVILLDALNTRLDDQMSVREALIRYLKDRPPGGPVAIFERDTKMHLVQGFTSDPQVLLAAAQSARNNPQLLKMVRGTREENLVYRMDDVTLGFQLLGRYLAAFPGRKNLIWFTGALPQSNAREPMSDPFNDDFRILEGDPHALTAALTLSRVAVYPVDARALQVAPQYEAASNRMPQPNAMIHFDNGQGFQHTNLDLIAEATGGRAFYSSNGLGSKIAEIENNGSSYYTLTYATTNKDWNGELRHIRIEMNHPHVKLQYRQGYFAVDRTKQEQAQLDRLNKAQHGENGSAGDEGSPEQTHAEVSGEQEPAKTPPVNAEKSAPRKDAFNDAMLLGAVPAEEIIFNAHVSASEKVVQLSKDDAWPQDNYLAADWKYKPFHTYTVEFTADGKTLQLTKGPDGLRHGRMAFVSIVYDQTAQNVNSILTTTNLDIDEDQYKELLQHGITARQEIAVPAKGSFFLRLGVDDTVNDRIGTLEFAVDQVRPEAGTLISQSK